VVPGVTIDSVGEMLLRRPFFLMERSPRLSLYETILAEPDIIPSFPGITAKLQTGMHHLDPIKLITQLVCSVAQPRLPKLFKQLILSKSVIG